MIWVTLDESSPTGTHEFADSVNNGPWGAALTTELIPWLEQHYRMDARPSGRFLTGHSSGGWATLWLQTRYPKIFGGTWSTSPDPSDFHDFTGADLYRANANVYVDAAGKPVPLVRMNGKDVANFEDFARLEAVLGPYGGQMASFDWVFSPKGADGRPMQMFDRRTGAVDPTVVAYWRDNYDIAYRLQRDWPAVRKDLDGKIHVIVGTADTFHLDGAAHKLQARASAAWARRPTCASCPARPTSTCMRRTATRSALTVADRQGNVCGGAAGRAARAAGVAASSAFVFARRLLDSDVVVAGVEIDFLVGADLGVFVDRQILGGELVVLRGLLGGGNRDFERQRLLRLQHRLRHPLVAAADAVDRIVVRRGRKSGSSTWGKCAWCPIRASPCKMSPVRILGGRSGSRAAFGGAPCHRHMALSKRRFQAWTPGVSSA